MESCTVHSRLKVRCSGLFTSHGCLPLLQRSLAFGLVPPWPFWPPSHSAHPRLQPTDIQRHVWPMSHGEVPLTHAQACPVWLPRPGCQISGELMPCSHRGSLRSIALRGIGEMSDECPAAVDASAATDSIAIADRSDGGCIIVRFGATRRATCVHTFFRGKEPKNNARCRFEARK